VNRILYSTDASLYQVMPYGVLLPRTMEDVQAAVELAAKYKVPILPRAGGSSLAGQATNEALIIDFTKHLNRVVEINAAEQWVRVQPGLVLDVLNRQLQAVGLKFGPDPASASRAALGGIVGNNSTGSHSVIYGMTADHLLEAEVFLSNGRIAHLAPLSAEQLAQQGQKAGFEGDIYRALCQIVENETNQAIIQQGTPRHWRRCGGYNLDRLMHSEAHPVSYHPKWPADRRFNLAKMMAGSEGTLAVFKELKLNLVPLPKASVVALVTFDDGLDALRAVPALLDLAPSAIELVDHLALTMCREVPEFSKMLDVLLEGNPTCMLTVEFYGDTEAELRAKISQLQQRVKNDVVGATAVNPLFDKIQQGYVWTIRKAGLGLLMSVRSDYKPIPFIEDSAVPVEHLAAYIEQIEAYCQALGTDIVYYAHASAGCLHIRPLINTKLGGEVDKLPLITRYAAELIREYGGAYSSEHGDGKARSWLNEDFYGKDLYGLYKQVKQAFDPDNILNPGNIVDAPPMTDSLRFGATYQTIPINTILDFEPDRGFGTAVEMCNGAGECRKTTIKTMCPPFMVTQDERDSTRGRANLLRAAMSGRLPEAEFTGKDVYDAMDLCISCKACKAECPSSVDMAKIKAEWLHHYYQANGTPLRARIFANIAPLSRLASGPLAPLLNFGSSLGLVQKLMAKTVGIGGKRPLPKFAAQSFQSWFNSHRSSSNGRNGRVVLFADTFNSYNYPDVAMAANEVLEAAGYEVILPRVTDTGRPALSKGLLKKAQSIADKVLTDLEPFAEAGLPIIFLEPSELSAIVDDYAVLLPQDGRLAQIKSHCFSFEQFMVEANASGKLDLQFAAGSRQVLLHGHCHQKALFGTEAMHGTLGLVPNTAVTEVDSGCCGMAGSFGYETEHFEMSLKMGERRLLTAVRQTSSDTYVVAAGVSCRQQIKFGAQRQALHPAQFLRQALVR
ncbi:MAG: FAD-linked oxidase C-terminal domain-containing protein, partial [Chloroflexota bacterium]